MNCIKKEERLKAMRVDGLKNRQKLVEVTIELVLEVGGAPPRDAIAERAGVGIGTLYRHFPDQQSLLHATARYALERSIEAGETLLMSVDDGSDVLRQYMHSALDHGIGVVNIIHPLLEKRDWADLTIRAGTLLKTIVQRAKQDNRCRADLSEHDIVFAMIRFARPLAIGLAASEERTLAHRHLDIYIDGLFSLQNQQRG